jgi:hypothetical protein
MNEVAALDLRTRALYEASALSDVALRTAVASIVGGAMLPGLLSRQGARERRRLAFYADLAAAQDPRAVFADPAPVRIDATPGRGPGVPGGRVELLRFVSPYAAVNPEVRADYARHEHNTIARAQHWRHEDGPRPTLCVIHGFGASPAWFNAAFFSLREFFAGGWDILLYTLPFHGGRRGGWTPVNGAELFAHGLAHFNEAMLHAVHDFRVLLAHLLDQGVPRAGVTGLSLGGYVTALLAASEPRLDFAIPNAAVTHLASLLHSWFPAGAVAGLVRRVQGLPDDAVERGMAVHSPLNYPPLLPKARLLVVGGLGDRLAPPAQSLLLWEHWDRPALRWFPGSHVLHFSRGDYLEQMRELMAA